MPLLLYAALTITDQWLFERTSALCNPLVCMDQCSFLRVLYTASSLHHQVSDFHWWFLERPQTLVAASSKRPFSIDQAASVRFTISASAPEAVAIAAAVVIVFTLKANWNCLSFQVRMWGENFFRTGDVSGEVTHYHILLSDTFFIRDDFHVPDCTAESLAIKNVVSELSRVLWVPKPCPPWASLNTQARSPTWPFQSPTGISISVAGTLATAYCSWS